MAPSRAAAPTPAVAALLAAGVPHELHAYDHDPAVRSYGEEAAAALGVEAARVLKTLVGAEPTGPVVALVPVTGHLSLKALGAAVGARRVDLVEPREAERLTGYVIGAISPLGQRRRHRTVVDAAALAWPSVFCSAGRRGLEVELAPADLVRLTDAVTAPIATARG